MMQMSKRSHLNLGDILLLIELQRLADSLYGGHLTILKFTTNWRVGFGTPNNRDDIQKLHVGGTFAASAELAILSLEHERRYMESLG